MPKKKSKELLELKTIYLISINENPLVAFSTEIRATEELERRKKIFEESELTIEAIPFYESVDKKEGDSNVKDN